MKINRLLNLVVTMLLLAVTATAQDVNKLYLSEMTGMKNRSLDIPVYAWSGSFVADDLLRVDFDLPYDSEYRLIREKKVVTSHAFSGSGFHENTFMCRFCVRDILFGRCIYWDYSVQHFKSRLNVDRFGYVYSVVHILFR